MIFYILYVIAIHLLVLNPVLYTHSLVITGLTTAFYNRINQKMQVVTTASKSIIWPL